MKKTLVGVLVFVLVLATVLTGTLLAKPADDDGHTNYLGDIPLVGADNPIQVDGRMDLAYTESPVAVVDFYASSGTGIYTLAYARFAWSATEKALYCFVIVNDNEICREGAYPWESDSVELFVDWSNSGTQDWGIATGISGDGALQRGLQYRISAQGKASCYLLEEVGAGSSADTYLWDDALGRFTNANNILINETTNIFGWTTDPDDATNVNKGWATSTTEYGYTAEFRINNADLTAGQEIGFDIQLNDLFNDGANQSNVYYSGKYRVDSNNVNSGSNSAYYDYFTLGDEAVANDRIISNDSLGEYGMDEATSRTTTAATTLRTTTQKVTIDRIHTYGTTTGAGGGNATQPGGTTAATTTAGGSSGGCGSSIAIGSSVAMIAMVGAAGFFAFRKKKDDR